jgi:hypothetical protein
VICLPISTFGFAGKLSRNCGNCGNSRLYRPPKVRQEKADSFS